MDSPPPPRVHCHVLSIILYGILVSFGKKKGKQHSYSLISVTGFVPFTVSYAFVGSSADAASLDCSSVSCLLNP